MKIEYNNTMYTDISDLDIDQIDFNLIDVEAAEEGFIQSLTRAAAAALASIAINTSQAGNVTANNKDVKVTQQDVSKTKLMGIKLGYDLVMLNEGFKSKPYYCTSGKKTIGYGFTDKKYVNAGEISEKDAKLVLIKYIFQCSKRVDQLGYKVKLTAHQRAVLIDMIYHFGFSAINNATDLRKAIDSGDSEAVRTQLRRWVNGRDGSGKMVQVTGLVNRQDRLVKLWH